MEKPTALGRTDISYVQASGILNKATGFLSGFDFTLNPYMGCSFSCSYCYAASFVAAPELKDSWGRWVKVKENAVELLQKRLKRNPEFLDGKRIYMSSATDPYQPIEHKVEITKSLLEVMAEHKPKLVVQTRSPGVIRDLDLLKQIERNGGNVQVNMTCTTDDDDIRRAFEPGCPENRVRLRAIGRVREAGLQAMVTITPLLLVKDAREFGEALLATGVPKFVMQAFHFSSGDFVADTRKDAVEIMAKKLGSTVEDFHREYLIRYKQTYDVLRSMLPNLGEGKSGFAPPW